MCVCAIHHQLPSSIRMYTQTDRAKGISIIRESVSAQTYAQMHTDLPAVCFVIEEEIYVLCHKSQNKGYV